MDFFEDWFWETHSHVGMARFCWGKCGLGLVWYPILGR
ncbi:hypothetical protein LCGC14_2483380, partial [marine sediment metagenome]